MAVDRVELDELLRLRNEAAALDLSSRRRVLTDLAGVRVSGFRGRGMEFEEHRVYQAGDELRTIDWRVTARTGTPHVRLYREERERPVLLAVDYRPGMWFGTRGAFKSVQAARAAAMLAWAAQANGDRVGGLLFGPHHAEVRPAGGRRGVLALLHALAADEAVHDPRRAAPEGSALEQGLQRLARTARPGTLVAVISDFRDAGQPSFDLLRRLGRHTELIIGFVSDPLDRDLPPAGRYPVAATDDATPSVLDSGSRQARTQWRQRYMARHAAIEKIARQSRAHWLELRTEQPAISALTRAFGNRRHRAA